MISLTPSGRRMLAFVVTMHRQGTPWTLRDAARHFGHHSQTSPHRLLTQLVDRGYVRRDRGKVTPLASAMAVVPATPLHFVPAPHLTRLS